MPGGSPTRLIKAALIALAVLVAVAALTWPKWRTLLEAAVTRDIQAGPLIVQDSSGAAVLATLVVHEQPRWGRRGTRRGMKQIVELQLNRMSDAADLGRVFVHATATSGNLSVYLLGAEADRVWIFAEGLRAVSVSRRELELDPATLPSRVPQLKDQLPDERKFYDFQPASGLRITTRDGERVVLNTQTWTLGPQPEPTPDQPARDAQDWDRRMKEWNVRMEEGTASLVAQLPGEFGLDSWRSGDRWFGMLSIAEQRQYSRSWENPGRHSSVDPERRKLWTAPVRDTSSRRSQLGEMQAVRDNTFLRGVFLRDGKRLRIVQAKDSPDLIVEHYSAVDDSAQMLLTRITPEGEVRWTTILPIKLPNVICATDEYVAFRGLPPRINFLHRAQLVCVKLSDGSFRTFSYN